MLEDINLTRRKTGVHLILKPGSLEKAIFNAATESLTHFYATQFLDELVDEPFLRVDETLAGYTNYNFVSTSFDNKKVKITQPKFGRQKMSYMWGNQLEGTFLTEGDVWGREERRLGHINLFQNSATHYVLDFSIFNIKDYDYSFSFHEETRAKHAHRFYSYVNNLMKPSDIPLLYIIGLEIGDLFYLESPTDVKGKRLMWRKLLRLNSNINFPIVLLGKERLINLLAPETANEICRLEPKREAQYLFDFIENLNEEYIRNDLTGRVDNSIRTIVYPNSVDYDRTLNLLKEKLKGRRMINEIGTIHL